VLSSQSCETTENPILLRILLRSNRSGRKTKTMRRALLMSSFNAFLNSLTLTYTFMRSSPNRVGVFPSFLPDLFTERSASLPRGCA